MILPPRSAPQPHGACRAPAVLCVLLMLLLTGHAIVLFAWWRFAWNLVPGPKGDARYRASAKHKLIFCSIPKNAGTSFSDVFCSLNAAGGSVPAPWWRRIAAMIRTRDDFELGCSWFSAAPSNQGLSNLEKGKHFWKEDAKKY